MEEIEGDLGPRFYEVLLFCNCSMVCRSSRRWLRYLEDNLSHGMKRKMATKREVEG